MPVFNDINFHLELNIKYRLMTGDMCYSSKPWKWPSSWKSSQVTVSISTFVFAYFATE